MSLPKYPAYKDSGVSWLGEVPAHWEVLQIKRLSPVQRGASPRPIDDPKFFDDDGEYSWVRIADVSASDGFLNQTTQRMSLLGSSLSVKIEPSELFVSIAGTVGKPCISNIKACIHDGFVYFPRLNLNPRFLFRVFEAGQCYAGLGKFGTQLNLNTDTIGSICVALPPSDEVRGICRFLDRETAKIDALIAEQEKLIALLAEKRQATISRAVTRGLDPNVPLKDSGVPWLGKVPAHWEVKSLRYLGKCQNGINIGAEAFGSGYPFVSYGNVYKNEVLPNAVDGLVQSSELDRELYSVCSGDVFFTRTSETVEEIGFSSVCLQDVEDAVFAGFLIRFRPVADVLFPNFSRHYFRSVLLRSFFVQEMNLVTRASLSQELLKRLAVPLPPLCEQIEIANYLDSISSRFDEISGNARSAISLLKERRAALISAAVTGKIDVRGLAA